MGPDPAGRRRLRELLDGPGVVVVPGVTNVLDARAAERAGFDVTFMTGAGIANSQFGFPDLGLLTMTEMVEAARRIAGGVGIPVIADADTGYGNHLNVMRTIEEFERAGVAAVMIEDQVNPKRCGHFNGKRVVERGEMIEKIVAAQMARKDPQLILVARTDALAVEGLEGALDRGRLYAEAGADVIFVEAPRTVEEMAEIPKSVAGPCMVNMVEGGLTPLLSAAELEELGFKLVLYANLALRVASSAVNRAFVSLRAIGSSADSLETMLTWEDRQRAVDLDGWQVVNAAVAEAARALVAEDADPMTLVTETERGGENGREGR